MQVAASRIPPAPEVFVGRQAIPDRLTQQLIRRRIVLLYGLAGVGKSSLVLALLQRLQDREGQPLYYYACQPGEDGQSPARCLVLGRNGGGRVSIWG